ncbi:unnamed protein product, partial [Prorocentrum cordatum]
HVGASAVQRPGGGAAGLDPGEAQPFRVDGAARLHRGRPGGLPWPRSAIAGSCAADALPRPRPGCASPRVALRPPPARQGRAERPSGLAAPGRPRAL